MRVPHLGITGLDCHADSGWTVRSINEAAYLAGLDANLSAPTP
ncbi:MAG: hypothetical protein ACREFP_10060 [Acetobacteraceae bacterium]